MISTAWEWIPPLIIITFPSLYWILNHLFHLHRGVAYKKPITSGSKQTGSQKNLISKPKDDPGERPRDKQIWIGHLIWNAIGITPLYIFVDNPWIVIFASMVWPSVGSLVMGKIRGRASVSTTLIFGMYGAIASLLWYLKGMKVIDDCIQSVGLIVVDKKFEGISLCYQTAQFWVNGWFTVSLAFMTLFGASLIPIYAIKHEDYGFPAVKEERQILAQLFSLSTMGLLAMGALGIGFPAIRYMNKIASELYVYIN